MRIEILGKDYAVSERLRSVVERKLLKLDKYFSEDAQAKVVARGERNERFTMEITVKFGGKLVRAEYSSDNMYDNIDVILPKIERQIRKHRTKLAKRLRPEAFEALELDDAPQASVKQTEEIARKKTFELVPMSVDEAILELDLLDHDFFVFMNVDNGRVNVVYKRGDGKFGLLDPQY